MLVFTPRINQNQVAVLQRRIIICVVQYTAVIALPHWVCAVPSTVAHELVQQLGFELPLCELCCATLHCSAVRSSATVRSLLHELNFCIALIKRCSCNRCLSETNSPGGIAPPASLHGWSRHSSTVFDQRRGIRPLFGRSVADPPKVQAIYRRHR